MRLLYSRHRCIAFPSPHWLWRRCPHRFNSILSIMLAKSWFYASTVHPRSLIQRHPFSSVSDSSSSRIAASGTSVPVICFIFLEENLCHREIPFSYSALLVQDCSLFFYVVLPL